LNGPWLRAAGAPFGWLGAAVVGASLLAFALQLLLPVGPELGAWDPRWSYAEVRLPAADAETRTALVTEAQARLPERIVELREDAPDIWLSSTGAAESPVLLSELREFLGERELHSNVISFGSNLSRMTGRALENPAAAVDAAQLLLPFALFGGSMILFVTGGLLLRRLRRDAPAPPPDLTRTKRLLLGIGLGLALAGLIQGVAVVMSALGHPLVEQPWVVELLEEGGARLFVSLPLIVLAAPLAEEVFFRGYMLQALRSPWGELGAIALSSAAFAAIHAHPPALPAYFLYGLGLALAARRTRSLLTPIAAHVTVNTLGVLAAAI
jgi:membrane protease YdiL (CAAX protease family)